HTRCYRDWSSDVCSSDLSEARAQHRSVSVVGGGSDLLGMIKERLVEPDLLVNLKLIRGLDQVSAQNDAVKIGGLITLDALSHNRSEERREGKRCSRAESM